MSPVETCHIRTIGIFLEENVIFAVIFHQSVRLVGPASTGHTMKTRTEDVVGETRGGDAHIHFVLGVGGIICYFCVAENFVVDSNIVNQAIECVDEATVAPEVFKRFSEHNVLATHCESVHTLGCGNHRAIVIEFYHAGSAIESNHDIVPLILCEFDRRGASNLPAAGVTFEGEVALAAQFKGKTFVGTLVDITEEHSGDICRLCDIHHWICFHSTPQRDCHFVGVEFRWVKLGGDICAVAIESKCFSTRTGNVLGGILGCYRVGFAGNSLGNGTERHIHRIIGYHLGTCECRTRQCHRSETIFFYKVVHVK